MSSLASPRDNLRRVSRLESRSSRDSRASQRNTTRRPSNLPSLEHHHGDHYVTFTATFAVAFKRNDGEFAYFNELVRRNEHSNKTEAGSRSKSLSLEAPKARHYFHTEFNLLQEAAKSEADVVTYGVACKMFREGETKLLRTFDDKKGDKTWFVYKSHHQIKVTDASLDSIYKNKVKIKLWEGKEKCIPRARFERPKAFRIQDVNPNGDIYHDFKLTTNEQDYPNSIPQREVNPGFYEPLRNVVESPVFEQRLNSNQLNKTAKSPISQLGMEHAGMKEELERVRNSMSKRKTNFDTTISRDTLNSGNSKSGRPNSASKLPHIQCELDLSVLFAGFKHVTSRGRLNQAAVSLGSGVRDMFVTFSIDRELLTEEQKIKLNPLVFRVISVTNLPNTPINKKQLAEKCNPVFCSYTFCGQKHVSHNKAHTNRRVTNFDDVKVFLVGKMDINKVIEEFQVKPFEFELHDRDFKNGENLVSLNNKPTLFGEDPNDENFGKLIKRNEKGERIGSEKSGKSEKSTTSLKNLQSHGIGKLDMKPLLEGNCTKLTETVPILPSSVKSSFGIPCGHYLQVGTELNVEIRVASPLVEQAKRNVKPEDRPFQFVCFLIERENSVSCKFISDIKTYICDHNKKHFKCDDASEILMTYDKSENNNDNFNSENWFSGFHLYDKNTHAICLESSAKNIKKFVEIFVPRIYNPEVELDERLCDVLFDSSLSFSKRVYSHNPILYTIKLHKPMAQILMNPKMYIEDHKDLVQGILTFWNLRTCRTLREAIRTESLPTKEQLLELQKSMGVPIYSLEELFVRINKSEEEQARNSISKKSDSNNSEQSKNSKERCWTPLDHSNRPFLMAKTMTNDLLLKSVEKHEIIQKNKRTVSNMSELVRHQNKKKLNCDRPYSQIFEELIMKQFLKLKSNIHKAENRGKLEEIYDRKFVLNEGYEKLKNLMESIGGDKDMTEAKWVEFLQEYLSASEFDKVKNFDKNNNSNRPPFRPFGHKTALESNQHVKKPSDDRVQELHKKWIENTLHTAKLEPTLPERDQIPDDKNNMRLYFGKMKVFDPNTPVSIFVGGDKQTEEMNRVKLRDQKIWADKLKGNERWKFYRQNSGTEQKFKLGPQFTMEKLKGILKDDPVLNNLKKFPAHDIPALPVFDK